MIYETYEPDNPTEVIFAMDSIIKTILGFDPIDEILAANTQQIYPIYENVSFYNTMNDVLIYANWDKIRTELNNEGY